MHCPEGGGNLVCMMHQVSSLGLLNILKSSQLFAVSKSSLTWPHLHMDSSVCKPTAPWPREEPGASICD